MAREHSHATEALMIISQTFFLVFLFIFLKKTLVDNRGMMANRTRMRKNAFQLVAIFFAIIVFLGLLTIPLMNYEYAEIVLIFTLASIGVIISADLKRLSMGQGASEAPLDTKGGEEDSIGDDGGDIETSNMLTFPQLPVIRVLQSEEKHESVAAPPPPKKEVQKSKSLFGSVKTVKSAFGTPSSTVNKKVSRPSNNLQF